jgi:hypothetical protein
LRSSHLNLNTSNSSDENENDGVQITEISKPEKINLTETEEREKD